MTTTTAKIRCSAKLVRPATPTGASWTFLILPKGASAKLPTRSTTTVEGTINSAPFRATLEPDGQRSHWLKVTRKLREAASGLPLPNGRRPACAGSTVPATCSLGGSGGCAASIGQGFMVGASVLPPLPSR